jgi:hypothetical protein
MKMVSVLQMSGIRDPEEEAEVQAWIEQVIGEKFPPGIQLKLNFCK